ncbi:ABC transporter transmembrane region [Rhizoctonia solani]|uniref:ABC transporter transmembrane region n=1 Tax=Rhizoctonia solani TaxID=456999 RepID=A0A8H7M4I6_9AGAM|nr:ABC transporter transmembrane region [Rhizoctonia solani]
MKLGYSRFISEKDMSALSPTDTAHSLSTDCNNSGRSNLTFIAQYQAGKTESSFVGWAIAAAMFVLSVVQTAMLHQYFQICFVTGMRVRAGLVTAIYNKALAQAPDSQGARGDVVNLMSVDATRLQDLCTYGLIALSGPLRRVVAGDHDRVLPLNTFIARVLKNMQSEQMKNRGTYWLSIIAFVSSFRWIGSSATFPLFADPSPFFGIYCYSSRFTITDKRTRLMSELLNNIKSIKLYAWEDSFIRRVLTVRNEQELKMLRKIGVTTVSREHDPLDRYSASRGLWIVATAAYTGERPLTADVIFPCIALFNLLQFPLAMPTCGSRRRSHSYPEFLLSEELQNDARIVDLREVAEGDTVLEVKGADFKWSRTAEVPTLEQIDLTVRKGELIGVLGRVGSGKTSLLSAVVGEMIREDGVVKINGRIAYAPQNPWIMNATIRENILFSHRYDEEFYNLVLDGILRPASRSRAFNDGDLTEVGEKGITLSGGQRARISLARACGPVSPDDPLAAVDAHVARHVFDRVIGPNGLLAGKARLHVTNSVAYLDQHDSIMMIRRGIILETGTYTEIVADPSKELAKLIANHKKGNSSAGASRAQSGTATPVNPPDELQQSTSASGTTLATSIPLPPRKRHLLRAQLHAEAGTDQKLEHREQGNVKLSVYKRYFEASSKLGVLAYILCMVAQQGCSIRTLILHHPRMLLIYDFSVNVALKMWGNHNQDAGGNSSVGYFLVLYGSRSRIRTFLVVASVLQWVFCAIKSARSLHDAMLLAVVRAPLSFFEQTPMGRIMNLFSRDQYVIDEVLVRVLGSFFRTMLVVSGIVVVVGGTFPWFLLTLIPWDISTASLCSTTSQHLRLDAVSKSPIFAWFQESLGGLSTIRAFSQQAVFMAQNEAKLDRNQMVYLPAVSVNRWLAVRLELLGSLIVLAAAIFSLVALVTTGVDAGLVGLVLSYGEVEQNLVSVERVVKHYCMRYRPELPLVLKNLTMSIRSGENIGVVGRTGAGKSSLFLSLLRILEPASGTICIDGVDITKIGYTTYDEQSVLFPKSLSFLKALLEKVDPTMSMTITRFGWHGACTLEEYVLAQGGLDAIVKEGGSSMSSGQRQLVCFARALLRNTKILILDEATSAVDLETDKAIQEIIRGPLFKGDYSHNCAPFAYCHRVGPHTSIEAGSVAELDTPEVLLKNESSLFYGLAAEAGLLSKST